VAILNYGQLVAQGPIGQLLGGDDNTVFQVALRGDTAGAGQRVQSQAWVAGLTADRQDGHMKWQVAVTDEARAESQLLRLILADEGVDVLSFGRRHVELEQVFMELVQEK
jgi:ABC-type multidrug transport system ATPase subunit